MRKLIATVLLFAAACRQGNTGDPPAMASTADTAANTPAVSGIDPMDSSFTALMQRKKAEGVDFYAIGQEPGWHLDIDKDSIFSFSSYEGTAMNTPPLMEELRGDTITYRASMELGEMIISIHKGECADVMSGRKFTHSVSVKIKRGTDKAFKTFEGCGAFAN